MPSQNTAYFETEFKVPMYSQSLATLIKDSASEYKPFEHLKSDETENLFIDDVGSCSGISKAEFSFTAKQETQVKPRF